MIEEENLQSFSKKKQYTLFDETHSCLGKKKTKKKKLHIVSYSTRMTSVYYSLSTLEGP